MDGEFGVVGHGAVENLGENRARFGGGVGRMEALIGGDSSI